ncbi:CHASE3 domain-containing protein [Nonomuraea turcica]|uniref:CHASE3 domain-containing protein n=1 Tax=Nonomuraea sp. G32 TaxID=3067274 RepID=UPI00273C0642|nr:CHASE3 domain-containing protein [Nonomuraea sp. G32]MDP4506943.1 CHASE3 domain-containing protein [Nonomuraea sp. G32]
MRAGLNGRMMIASTGLAMIIAITFTILYLAIADLGRSSALARHSRQELVIIGDLSKLIIDAETGLRGFVITREELFLEPWYAARRDFPEQARELAAFADDPGQRRRASQLVAQGVSYIEEYSVPVVRAVRRGDPATHSVATTLEGKRQVDALRNAFDRYTADERAILDREQDAADRDAQRAVMVSMVGLAGSVALMILFATYLSRAIVQPVRRAAQMADQLAGGDLGIRMSGTGVGETGTLERSLNAMAQSLQDNRDELRRLADEQVALRRVATLVAHGLPPAEIFAAVAEEAGRILGADATTMLRYEADGTATVVAAWGEMWGPDLSAGVGLGGRLSFEDSTVAARVRDSGLPARADLVTGSPSSIAAFQQQPAFLRELGVRSIVGVPIAVEGHLWGVAGAFSAGNKPLPDWTEARLADFTDLVATAIANSQARADLAASRARVVAAGDQTRRRLERDLHDGVQQRLVSLALAIRAAQAGVPPTLPKLHAELSEAVSALAAIMEDLRDISRGIHPAILSEGGLAAALKALARRSSIPVELDVPSDLRLGESVDVAAYYVAAEALTNAAKHAHASVVQVEAAVRSGRLYLAVRDDGVGGADLRRGTGLIGLTDRVEALGGTIMISSPPGKGTSLQVELPVDDA